MYSHQLADTDETQKDAVTRTLAFFSDSYIPDLTAVPHLKEFYAKLGFQPELPISEVDTSQPPGHATPAFTVNSCPHRYLFQDKYGMDTVTGQYLAPVVVGSGGNCTVAGEKHTTRTLASTYSGSSLLSLLYYCSSTGGTTLAKYQTK